MCIDKKEKGDTRMEVSGLKVFMVVISTLIPILKVQANAPCTTDTWGREFYVAVFNPGPYKGSVTYTLYAQSKQSGRITISAPGANYQYISYLRKGSRSIVLPDKVQTSNPDSVNRTGIKVTTGADVALTLFVTADDYRAAALVLPTKVLSTEYIVPHGKHNVLIVGLQNSTRFDATDSYISNQNLNEFDVYEISGGSSTVGTTVINSNHPVAVFVVSNTGHTPSYFEQMIPTSAWGYRYIVPDFYDDRHYSFQVTASQDDTYLNTYYKSHPGTMYLQKGRVLGASSEYDPYVLTSSKPIMVMQYGTAGLFMTNLPAISQFSNSYYVNIPSSVAYFYNNIVLISTELDEGGITFDATYIPTRKGTSTVMVDNVKYIITSYAVSTGDLRVFHTSSTGKFGGFAYGYRSVGGRAKAYYAYPLGLTLKEEGCVPPTTTTTTSSASISSIVPSSHTNDTVCFACQDMSSLVFCDHVQTCDKGKKCFVEKHLTSGGEVKYSSGCTYQNMCHQTTSSNSSCRHCCDGSYCNNVGCGDTSTPARSNRGPFCYDCSHVGRAEDCHRATLCRSDQVCSMRKYSWGDTLSHYTLGCEDKTVEGSLAR